MMMMNNLEIRSAAEAVLLEHEVASFMPGLSLKADGDEEGVFEGYASLFETPDLGGDIVEAGAFRKSLAAHKRQKSKPALLWQHDSWRPIGVWEEVREDNRGLKVRGRLSMDVAQGREAHALLRDGALSGMSIGYKPLVATVRDADDPDNVRRRLKQIDLVEISLVTFPMQRRALVDEVRSTDPTLMHPESGEMERRQFEQILRAHGFSRDQAKAIAARGLRAAYEPAPSQSGSEGEARSQSDAFVEAGQQLIAAMQS